MSYSSLRISDLHSFGRAFKFLHSLAWFYFADLIYHYFPFSGSAELLLVPLQ